MSDDSDIDLVPAAGSSPPAAATTPPPASKEPTVQVIPSPIPNVHEYEYVEGSDKVYKVLKEYERGDALEYLVMFGDTHTGLVSELIGTAHVHVQCHMAMCATALSVKHLVPIATSDLAHRLTLRRHPSNNSWNLTTAQSLLSATSKTQTLLHLQRTSSQPI